MKGFRGLVSLLLALCLLCPPIQARETPPFALRAVYLREEKLVSLEIVTTEQVALSNYDLQLEWDATRFAPPELTAWYIGFSPLWNAAMGKCSAMSAGENVVLEAEAVLAAFTLRPLDALGDGDHAFSLRVEDAADADMTAAPWMGGSVSGALHYEAPKSALGEPREEAGELQVEALCPEEAGGKLFCAAYSQEGRLLRLETLPVPGDGESHTYRFSLKDAASHRLFLLDEQYRPLCPGAEYPGSRPDHTTAAEGEL